MSMKLYVGNLAFETSSNELQTLFAQAGTVESVSLIEDRETGRSRGFGFVEMSTKPNPAKIAVVVAVVPRATNSRFAISGRLFDTKPPVTTISPEAIIFV